MSKAHFSSSIKVPTKDEKKSNCPWLIPTEKYFVCKFYNVGGWRAIVFGFHCEKCLEAAI